MNDALNETPIAPAVRSTRELVASGTELLLGGPGGEVAPDNGGRNSRLPATLTCL